MSAEVLQASLEGDQDVESKSAPGWKAAMDPTTSCWYYYHPQTHQTSWEVPDRLDIAVWTPQSEACWSFSCAVHAPTALRCCRFWEKTKVAGPSASTSTAAAHMEPAQQDPAAAQPAETGEAHIPTEGQPDGGADQQRAGEAFGDDDPTFDLDEVGVSP